VTRDLQSTNRYEHSLDSAMRPVRPDGISRRTREPPLRRATPLLGTHCWEVILTGEPLGPPIGWRVCAPQATRTP